MMEGLESLVSQSGNYKAMRKAIKETAPPVTPYIGMFLTDLTFIEDGTHVLVLGAQY